jgi:hypothetical protein
VPIELGLKTAAIVGGASTAMLAEAVFPVPPSTEVTAPVVFVWLPAALPVNITENWQFEPVAIDPPDRANPSGAVRVTVPVPQALAEPVETVSPVGSVSVKPTPVSPTVLPAGLVIVKLSETLQPSGSVAALNADVMAGGATIGAASGMT